MNALTGTVSAFCRREGIVLQGKTVLTALSGGRDSIALLCALMELGTEEGFSVAAAHYNHHLRKTAQRDEKFVRAFCAGRGIPLVVGGGDVAAFAREMGMSTEEAARTLRYRFLEEAAEQMGADFIATAHHEQDNAETILINLLRGTGLRGLGGIPPVRGRIIRPLLAVSRREINNYIEQNTLPYVEDETNAQTVYTRNRLRKELLPLLDVLFPGSVERIALAASRFRQDEDYLEQQAERLLPPAGADGETWISGETLNRTHPAVSARLLRLAARRLGTELTAAQVESVLSLRHGVAVLSKGVRAARDSAGLRFYRIPPPRPTLLLHEGEQDWGEYRVTVRVTDGEAEENENTIVLRTGLPSLTIAPWDGTGRLAVENGRRTVKRLLTDRGIGAAKQENRPAVFAGDTLAAVFGAGTSREFAAEEQKKLVITLVRRG